MLNFLFRLKWSCQFEGEKAQEKLIWAKRPRRVTLVNLNYHKIIRCIYEVGRLWKKGFNQFKQSCNGNVGLLSVPTICSPSNGGLWVYRGPKIIPRWALVNRKTPEYHQRGEKKLRTTCQLTQGKKKKTALLWRKAKFLNLIKNESHLRKTCSKTKLSIQKESEVFKKGDGQFRKKK